MGRAGQPPRGPDNPENRRGRRGEFLPNAGDKLAEIAKKHHATEAQINLAWLLHKSPWILPIPGTPSLAHLRENLKGADIKLSAEDMAYLG